MNRIIFSVKVCEKEKYREDFLDGNLHMNTLGYFRRYEDSREGNVGDPHEAAVWVLQPGQFTMTINVNEPLGLIREFTIPAEDIAAPTILQYEGHNNLNLFCMYAVHDGEFTSASEQDFERFVEAQMLRPEVDGLGDFAAIIVKTKDFQDRVFHALRQALQRDGLRYMAGLVSYYDPATFHGQFDEDRAVFNKRSTFAHQREYRFALDRGSNKGEAIKLSVGSLRDICIACRTEEVNEKLRDFLYQLRAQGVFG